MQDFKSLKWLEDLLDDNSFQALDFISPGHQSIDAVTTGLGKIRGRPVALYAQNTEINRGYINHQTGHAILQLMRLALEKKIPIIALLSSPGIDLEDDLASGLAYSEIISQNIACSGIIPQFAVIMGPTLGAPAYSSVLMDLCFFSQHRSHLMVTSPAVVKEAIGETTTLTELGGANVHGHITGLVDFVDKTTELQLEHVKELIEFFPSHFEEKPKRKISKPPLKALPTIPINPMKSFDMMALIEAIVDESHIHFYRCHFGPSILCAFAYLDGFPVGIIANQSKRLSGAIDCDASQKSSRFIRLCDAYNIPIITLIDVPGFMPGKREEQRGLLKYGAKFCFAMQTVVPRLSVVVRKAYGAAAFLMMQTKAQGGDLVLALKESQIGAMGQKASAKVREAEHQNATNATLNNESLLKACEKGLIDEVIDSTEIRSRLSFYLPILLAKPQKERLLRKHFIEP